MEFYWKREHNTNQRTTKGFREQPQSRSCATTSKCLEPLTRVTKLSAIYLAFPYAGLNSAIISFSYRFALDEFENAAVFVFDYSCLIFRIILVCNWFSNCNDTGELTKTTNKASVDIFQLMSSLLKF
uniref:Uncharacterized protein n=1 Tax=Glossina brevipalpis TaxID=37001 RepID=A0A1A9WXM5_9MUSC